MNEGFSHEAFFYAGLDEFVEGVIAFVHDGVTGGEPTLVMVDAGKIRALRAALGHEAEGVHFADMTTMGLNPARIIPAWHQFVVQHGAGPGRAHHVRCVGEPVWAGRNLVELVECRHHEALLNVAFADTPGFRLLCPYDTSALDPTVISHALHTHPFVSDGGARLPSPSYEVVDPTNLFEEPLPAVPDERHELVFASLRAVRQFVSDHMASTGVDQAKANDVVLAVNEIAANSLRHGGGKGRLSIWFERADRGTLVCQVDDRGQITDPLVGRRDPSDGQRNGRGLWIVHKLCDLAQVRTSPEGTATRLHFRALSRRPARVGVTSATGS